MRSLTFFIFIFSLVSLQTKAQSFLLSGKITDQQNQVVSFASVYVKSTTKGTSANSEGEYQLRLAPGKYEVVVKAVGYKQFSRQIDLASNLQLNISLNSEVYQLNDVVIRSGGEDPAYAIMRKAIRKRKSFLNEVNSYSCDVYIKGLQKLLAAPKKFMGRDIDKIGKEIGLDSNRRGIVYLSESESKFSFMQPDKVHEEMISSKFSGSNRAFSFNRASDMDVNFYKNIQSWGQISNRPLISPLADNALTFYKYKFLGASSENGELINKIQVIPRHKGDPVFGGVIYIVEDSWRIYAVDLMVTKDANINFVDTLKVNQQFFPVRNKTWMPATVKFEFTGGIFGFKVGGYFVAVYKNYELNNALNKKIFEEVMRVTKGVNKKDSAYWQESRPIPLTDEEKTDYRKKEALATKRESKVYLDSLDKSNNTFRPLKLLIGSGYTVRNRYQKKSITYGSLLSAAFYNTVEGFGLDYSIDYRKQIDSASNKYLILNSKLRYGFKSQKFHPLLTGTIPLKTISLGFDIGSSIIDLNNHGTISERGNTINSLFYEQNYMKLYQKDLVGFSLSKRVFGGISLSVSTEFADRKWLNNVTDFTFRDVKNREFTANNPFSPVSNEPLFANNQSLKAGLKITYDFSKKYVTYPSGKYYIPSKYPRLNIIYTKGISNVFGSDVDFDLLQADISKTDVSFGLYGKSSFMLGAGRFLNRNKLFYTDYNHFSGNQTLTFQPKNDSFLYLDYYQHSTSQSYLEAHLMHNFAGLFLSKVPLIKKFKLQEIVGGNYLATPSFKNYSEAYFGLQYLNFRLLYGYSFERGTQVDKGFKFAYRL